ncbi:MAG: ABC transporter ATP-binding protein [Magnetococcales bacterium]|nr:ABC transporter ATP-binding protein [Magnetococcales bacterium]
MNTVIDVVGVWKRYGPPLPAFLAALARWRGGGLPWALQDLSFHARPGETLGIIGRNGAGKSTLLKLLAGVTPPNRGSVRVEGRIFPMIELNAGIHQDLTGRENVRLLGAVMGLGRREVIRRMGEIEEFCGLGAWFDRPVRMYSSGMLARLGFAAGAHVEADVLLMDEVMAVGDINFHNRCLQHLEEVRARGRTILFVSHAMPRIRRLCDRVLVLEGGRALFLGATEEGIGVYDEVLRRARQRGEAAGVASLTENGVALTDIAWLEPRPAPGEVAPVLQPGDDVALRFTLRVDQPLELATLNVALEDMEAVSVVWSALQQPRLEPGLCSFQVRWKGLRLRPGEYAVRLGVVAGALGQKIFRRNPALTLRIAGDSHTLGVCAPETEFAPEA